MNAALVAAQEGRLDCLRYLVRVERELVKTKDRNGFNVIHYGMFLCSLLLENKTENCFTFITCNSDSRLCAFRLLVVIEAKTSVKISGVKILMN